MGTVPTQRPVRPFLAKPASNILIADSTTVATAQAKRQRATLGKAPTPPDPLCASSAPSTITSNMVSNVSAAFA
jgi:hypothetical protein